MNVDDRTPGAGGADETAGGEDAANAGTAPPAALRQYLHALVLDTRLTAKLGRLLRRHGSLAGIAAAREEFPGDGSDEGSGTDWGDGNARGAAGEWLRHLVAGGTGGVPRESRAVTAAIDAQLRWAEGPGRHILCFEDERFPPLLREIPCPPPVLFVAGQLAALVSRQVALVGSRRATRYGLNNAATLGGDLARHGITVTSGLARGIDTQAHRAALAGGGSTVAVIGTGMDIDYPPRHDRLRFDIIGNGAVVSEFPLGTPPHSYNFPRRNRIISGLSLGTVVIEAALRSGSLITARLAAEQNREVFAVPGPMGAPASEGCHALIQAGAKLITGAADVVEDLGLGSPPPSAAVGGQRVSGQGAAGGQRAGTRDAAVGEQAGRRPAAADGNGQARASGSPGRAGCDGRDAVTGEQADRRPAAADGNGQARASGRPGGDGRGGRDAVAGEQAGRRPAAADGNGQARASGSPGGDGRGGRDAAAAPLLTALEATVLNEIDPRGSTLEQIMLGSDQSFATLTGVLLDLELRGALQRLGGRYYRL